jgi:hypothetical protein
MANFIRGEVAVESNGQTYTLVMTTNALVELQGVFSTPDKPVTLTEVLRRVVANDVEAFRAFVWAATRRHHPALTLEGAGDLIDGAGGLAGFALKIEQLATSLRPDPADAGTAGSTDDAGRPTDAQTSPASGIGRRSIGTRARSA